MYSPLTKHDGQQLTQLRVIGGGENGDHFEDNPLLNGPIRPLGPPPGVSSSGGHTEVQTTYNRYILLRFCFILVREVGISHLFLGIDLGKEIPNWVD